MLSVPWNWKQIGLTDFVSEREETGRSSFLSASPDTPFALDWRWPEGVADPVSPVSSLGFPQRYFPLLCFVQGNGRTRHSRAVCSFEDPRELLPYDRMTRTSFFSPGVFIDSYKNRHCCAS